MLWEKGRISAGDDSANPQPVAHFKIDMTNDFAFDPRFTAAGNHGSTGAHSTRNGEKFVFMAFAVIRKGSGQEAFVFGDRGQSKVAVVTHKGFYVPPGWHGHQNDPRIRTAQNGILDYYTA